MRCTDHKPPRYVVLSAVLLDPNTLFGTLLSNTLSLRVSLNVSDRISHPCTTTGSIIVLCVLILTVLDGKLEHKRFFTE